LPGFGSGTKPERPERRPQKALQARVTALKSLPNLTVDIARDTVLVGLDDLVVANCDPLDGPTKVRVGRINSDDLGVG
jgi:hypothetical protein